MTRPGIETRYTGPLANTLTIMLIHARNVCRLAEGIVEYSMQGSK